MNSKTFKIVSDKAGCRLDVFLSSEYENRSRSQIKLNIEEGLVCLNGKPVTKAGTILKTDDFIEIEDEKTRLLEAVAEDIPIDITFQDDSIAVINKAQGIVTHPAIGSLSGTLVNAALFHINNLSTINGVIRPGIVHRLDKNTSGLIVIAKNDTAHKSLSKQIADRTAFRKYIAIVDGNIKTDAGKIEVPLKRSKSDRKKIATDENGRYALTYFNVLERFQSYTLVEFCLATGRTHQIRVHAQHIHHPIIGDDVYGGSNKFGLKGQLLHAYQLELTHPVTQIRMKFSAPLPDYFEKVLEILRSKNSR
ncbi:MAG: RluA family pseudouridine synthase [Christensenellaceae bacterium]|jgi:23S rRNA pseudouridine1911/1915/1917 synthase|nr:RluA family pseudouridine synthase [Christensenellaceae bacterium]